jgi:hypothetical protein
MGRTDEIRLLSGLRPSAMRNQEQNQRTDASHARPIVMVKNRLFRID